MADSLWAVMAGGAISLFTTGLQLFMSQRSDRSRAERESEHELARERRNERAVLYRNLLKIAHAAQTEAAHAERFPMAQVNATIEKLSATVVPPPDNHNAINMSTVALVKEIRRERGIND